MAPSVEAAWISGTVAIGIAIVGVLATGVAQWRAAKTSHRHALDLFERQSADQARVRAEQDEERRRMAFLTERSRLYARLMRVNSEFQEAVEEDGRWQRTFQLTSQDDKSTPEVRKHAMDMAAATQSRRRTLLSEAKQVLNEIELVCPTDVYLPARDWTSAIEGGSPNVGRRGQYVDPSAAFVSGAKRDVGVDATPSG